MSNHAVWHNPRSRRFQDIPATAAWMMFQEPALPHDGTWGLRTVFTHTSFDGPEAHCREIRNDTFDALLQREQPWFEVPVFATRSLEVVR